MFALQDTSRKRFSPPNQDLVRHGFVLTTAANVPMLAHGVWKSRRQGEEGKVVMRCLRTSEVALVADGFDSAPPIARNRRSGRLARRTWTLCERIVVQEVDDAVLP
jgi:hypothetical protein